MNYPNRINRFSWLIILSNRNLFHNQPGINKKTTLKQSRFFCKPENSDYASFLLVENLKIAQIGQKLKMAVPIKITEINPHQLSNKTPRIAITNPSTILSHRSIDPTFFFISISV